VWSCQYTADYSDWRFIGAESVGLCSPFIRLGKICSKSRAVAAFQIGLQAIKNVEVSRCVGVSWTQGDRLR
jgi:hypothetical protein